MEILKEPNFAFINTQKQKWKGWRCLLSSLQLSSRWTNPAGVRSFFTNRIKLVRIISHNSFRSVSSRCTRQAKYGGGMVEKPFRHSVMLTQRWNIYISTSIPPLRMFTCMPKCGMNIFKGGNSQWKRRVYILCVEALSGIVRLVFT